MKKRLTLIWIVKNDEKKTRDTLNALLKQSFPAKELQLILCLTEGTKASAVALPANWDAPLVYEGEQRAEVVNRAMERLEAPFTTFIVSGDTFAPDYISNVMKAWEKQERYSLLMPSKRFVLGVAADSQSIGPDGAHKLQFVDFDHTFDCLPCFLAGTWFRTEVLRGRRLRQELANDCERELLLWLILELRSMIFVNIQTYLFDEAPESDRVYYPGCYRPDWYYESIDLFWVPFLGEVQKQYGEVPYIIQYQALATLRNRFEANVNNKDKHCVPIGEAVDYVMGWERMLRYVDDALIMNRHSVRSVTKNPFFQRMLLRVKYQDAKKELKEYHYKGKLYYGFADILSTAQEEQKAQIQLMEYRQGKLLIDGIIPNIYDFEKGTLYIRKDRVEYPIRFTNRYAHTKIFGNSVYKSISFEAEVPISSKRNRQQIELCYSINGENYLVELGFLSFFSRLSDAFTNSYWMIGNKKNRLMVQYSHRRIIIKKVRRREVIKQELGLWKEMLFPGYEYKKNQRLKQAADPTYVPHRMLDYVMRRAAYFGMQKVWKKRPIWLFFDKIYKAGDSAEYLYRYAVEQKDGIDKYYLIDKNAPDCERLKRDGFKPLIRDSLKAKLIFMYADMLIISNATVFEFNGYDLETSSFVRDLFHFDVACVQHGMSVQKIAIAQNRMRDNISLYFCASQYEIDNLNRPIYDYVGRDILRLTGVPRYDGLVNEDKKQLLITPTWRMQAAMPVTRSESYARDYNPMFKETNYYQVYNSLINDPRLLEAARRYGYRIHYVLHPIVSPQAEDFDKNDVVDIIPATGDMSYEKEFRESSLMVSDYSGVQFDFAYMRKPVVYLHHEAIPQHYEEGTFHYDTMAFGEICHTNDELIDVLIEYMKNDCRMKPQFRARADDFFHFDDHNNCKRIYDVMIEKMKKS